MLSLHHDPRTTSHVNPLAAVVGVADDLANQGGVGILNEPDQTTAQLVIDYFELDSRALDSLVNDANEAVNRLDEISAQSAY